MGLGRLGQTLTAREIFELVKKDLERVEREISLESVASVDAVTTISRYLQDGGGKRLRPILVLLASQLVGGVSDGTIRMAAVVEMIHAATLVHDDVIDIAKTRRGRPSSNAIWGNHTCVLAGDWLYMQAFQVARARAKLPCARFADRADANDGGRRTAAVGAHRQDRYLGSRLHGIGGSQDRQPVLGLRASGRR